MIHRLHRARDRRGVTVVDSRREALNEIRDRYEQLRAEVQARRRKAQSSAVSQRRYVDAFQ